MVFDFKKEMKELYAPKNKPEMITVPKANYIAVRGSGDPNEEDCTMKFIYLIHGRPYRRNGKQ